MRLIELINTASEYLAEKGFDNARLEVEILLGKVLGLSRLDLYMSFDRPVEDDELEQFRALYLRRLSGEPLQYIVGSTGFMDIELKTDGRAFIPRPETELLVERAVEFLKRRSDPVFADLGTGSGAIVISVLFAVPEARAVAVDLSDEALLLAGQNASTAGVDHALTLVSGDMTDALEGRGPFDAILSNPPYVRTGDIDSLQPEIREYEPRGALDGGADGMTFLARIARDAHRHLKPGGLLLMECEGDQADRAADLLESAGKYVRIGIVRDLAGRKRIVRAERGDT